MLKFAANLSLMFTEHAYPERFAAAARAGFAGVEVLFPYDHPPRATRELLLDHGLTFVLANAPPPIETGPRGFPVVAHGQADFQAAMEKVLSYCSVVRPGLIHVMAGYERGADAHRAFVRNLQWLADFAPEQQFAIEPLNERDQPGYFLDDYGRAMEVIAAVDRGNVGLQYDTYHAQMIHGDAVRIWDIYGGDAVHVQIGASPDRSEPGRGPIDFPALFAAIDNSGYSGWISAEYFPSTARTEDSLGWLSAAKDAG